MTGLLSWLIYPLVSGSALTVHLIEKAPESGKIGFIVMGVIFGPVIVLAAAAIIRPPRSLRVSGLFLGSLILLIGAILTFFAVSGMVMHFIVPQ